ncbi:MAG: 50S ribosomal protein L24 [Flavobacteriales bacterium]|jgi:large subunit ribosomal protein L24
MMFKRLKIKKNDLVTVVSGEHKGKQGRVIEVDRKTDRVLVEGVNLVTRHRKPSAQNPQGGIEKKEAGIHISNVMVVDTKGGVTRVGRRRNSEGKLERYSKKSGEALK